ncbi:hypothetical protein E1269_09075 [Jiangella asiatica]|uniref:Uncharacterized protein n=1 Tax=Jiangella asiatica TaxID=2530372 RepID=A0A4R5DFF2_9ACTN|nr:hypothetical protein E1269_09075 [Jiangella asiatica]
MVGAVEMVVPPWWQGIWWSSSVPVAGRSQVRSPAGDVAGAAKTGHDRVADDVQPGVELAGPLSSASMVATAAAGTGLPL